MKDFKDEKIIEAVRADCSYEVKTTSQSILQRHQEYEISKQEKSHQRYSKQLTFGLLTIGTVIACVSLIFTFVYRFNEDDLTSKITISNKNLENQLSAFSLLIGEQNNVNSYKMAKKGLLKENQSDFSQEYFKEIVDAYDEYNLVMENAFADMRCEGEKYEKEMYGDYYNYIDKIYFADKNIPFAELYFNDESMFDDKASNDKTYEALYITYGVAFDLQLTKSIEVEEDETETYYFLLFMNKENSTYYSVEKEHEIEEQESEFAYSITTYASKNDFNSKQFIEKVTYELENENGKESKELVIEKENKEYHFENIVCNASKQTFEAYIETDVEELEHLIITLTYQNNSKIYESGSFSYEK